MTYSYQPPPVYVVQARKPPYRTGASISWLLVNIWNTLNTLALLVALVASLVGAGLMIDALRKLPAGTDDAGIPQTMAMLAGGASAVSFIVLGAAFVVALIFTICTWYKLWPALLIQTMWYTLCTLAASALVLSQTRSLNSQAATETPWGPLIAVWAAWLIWMIFTILTAPGNAHRRKA